MHTSIIDSLLTVTDTFSILFVRVIITYTDSSYIYGLIIAISVTIAINRVIFLTVCCRVWYIQSLQFLAMRLITRSACFNISTELWVLSRISVI